MSAPEKHFYTCKHCGIEFWSYKKPWQAPKTCSTKCHRAMNVAHLKSIRNKVTPIINICEICQKKFIGRIKYHSYRACSSPECRTALRRQVAKEISGKGVKGHQNALRECLRCGQEFKSCGKGNRVCTNCRERNRELSSSLAFWG